MSEGSFFPVAPTSSDRTIDESGSDSQIDPEIVAVRNLINEECTLPTRQQKTAHIIDPPPPKKNRVAPRVSKVSNWFRWTIQTLAQTAAAFLRRPDAPRILAILILFATVVTMPWFVLSLAVSGILIALIIYFSLGPDKVNEMVAAWYARLRARDPGKAEKIRHRAAVWSKRIAALVRRFPDKWTTGLYLPDFDDASALPEKMKTDPFDRLAQHDASQ